MLDALITCHNWITFEPPHPFVPGQTQAQRADLERALTSLVQEGWRGLVTYSVDPTQGLEQVPSIAKKCGFSFVIAGLFVFDEAQFVRERQAALRQVEHIDAYVLGNEVLNRGVPGFTIQRLSQEIQLLKADTGRPVTTSESINQYEADPALVVVGDWVFPNIHPFASGIRTVAEAVQDIENKVGPLASSAAGRPVVLKEAWWPTAGDTAASEGNQIAFFSGLAHTSIRFVFGESYDMTWKTAEGPFGPHWGLHDELEHPKRIIRDLQGLYTSPY